MNERIKELYKQAGLTMNNPLAYEQWYLDSLEKFAELIVRECMGIAEENQPRDVDWSVSDIIRVHFGVEKWNCSG